jgi:hypothetical protein
VSDNYKIIGARDLDYALKEIPFKNMSVIDLRINNGK